MIRRRLHVKSALMAAVLAQFFLFGLPAHAQSSASASASAPAAPENVVRPEVYKAMQAAQEAARANKFAEGIAKLNETDPLPNKTPFESYSIERMRGLLAAGADNAAQATKSLESALTYAKIEPTEKLHLLEVLASVYYNAKDYPKAIATATRYLNEGGTGEKIHVVLARAYYLSGDFAHAIPELTREIQVGEKAGKQPSEEQLRLLGSAQSKVNDKAAYVQTLERLVELHPKPDYWADLLARLFSKQTFSDRLLLDAYRLKFAVGDMEEARDYLDMAELASRAGFPAEAKKVLDAGFQAGVLGKGADAGKHKKLLDATTKSAAEDQKAMTQGEADAAKKKDGTGLVNLGYAFVTAGQFDKGLALMEQGIQKGGMKHPEDAKLHLALALAKAGKKDEAIEKLKTVQGNDGLSDLARYWTMYLKQAK